MCKVWARPETVPARMICQECASDKLIKPYDDDDAKDNIPYADNIVTYCDAFGREASHANRHAAAAVSDGMAPVGDHLTPTLQQCVC